MRNPSKWCVLICAAAILSVVIVPGWGQKGPVADNSVCHVCHVNFATEELAVNHANSNVGCVSCHGFSQAHAGDEENTTPPDRMWPKDEINKTCATECHSDSKLPEVHKDLWEGKTESTQSCMECHGKHRIETRTVRWNRKTGEVIE